MIERSPSLTDLAIICTRNRTNELNLCVQHLSYSRLLPKIWVIDSSDMKEFSINSEFLKAYSFVEHFECAAGLTVQRNFALDRLKNFRDSFRRVHFLDDDSYVSDKYIEEMSLALELPFVIGATGFDQNNVANHRSIFRQVFKMKASKPGGISKAGVARQFDVESKHISDISWLSGCSMSFNIENIIGNRFDTRLKGYSLAEDLWFSFNLSRVGRLVHIPTATYKHLKSPNNRIDISSLNICEKLHRLYFISAYNEFFSKRAFYVSILGELILDFYKLIRFDNQTSFLMSKIKSNISFIRELFTKNSDLQCNCKIKLSYLQESNFFQI